MTLTDVKSGRQKALAGALAVLRDEGPEGLTMRAVAERAGLTPPAIYWHFSGKEELVRAVHAEAMALYRDRAFAALEGDGAEERLLGALDAFRAFALDEPNLFRVLFLDPPRTPEKPLSPDRGRRSTVFQLLVDRVAECMRAGVLREADAVSVALTLSAMAQGVVTLRRRGRFTSDEEFTQFYRDSFRRLIDGLR